MIEEYYPEPNNIIKNIQCPDCHAWFTCTVDFGWHKKVKCKLRLENKVGWRKSKKNPKIDVVFKDNVPNILVTLRNGHLEFNGYKYWIYNDFVCRKRIGDD